MIRRHPLRRPVAYQRLRPEPEPWPIGFRISFDLGAGEVLGVVRAVDSREQIWHVHVPDGARLGPGKPKPCIFYVLPEQVTGLADEAG